VVNGSPFSLNIESIIPSGAYDEICDGGVVIKVLDAFGNTCTDFSGQISLYATGVRY